MDHSSEDLYNVFLNKGMEKQPYELKNNIHTLFSTPHVHLPSYRFSHNRCSASAHQSTSTIKAH